MNITGFLNLIFLIAIQCGCIAGSFVSQMESTVRVQSGLSTSLNSLVQQHGRFSIFWIKVALNNAPVCVATAKGFVDVEMCEQFKNHSRIKVTWKNKNFKLLFSSVEQTDIATYICGAYDKYLLFGNGTKLILEDAVSPNSTIKDKDGNVPVFEYIVPALAATNGVSTLLIIWLCHRRKRSGVRGEAKDAGGDEANEVNYTALTFCNKEGRTVQKTNMDHKVIYGAVRLQEEFKSEKRQNIYPKV